MAAAHFLLHALRHHPHRHEHVRALPDRPFIEQVFGRARYLLIYFLAGIFGSLVSAHVPPQSVGAGASGAIFVLYGAVFGFLMKNHRTLHPAITQSIGKSVSIFDLYNVVLGAWHDGEE